MLGIFFFLDSISKKSFMDTLKKKIIDGEVFNFLVSKKLKPSTLKLVKVPIFPSINLEINLLFNKKKDCE
jgi:hypothetical protein